ncbi:DUF928 domain-containing protein [Anabaena cylindrica FACHB-243]|uniref:DUF928 domain-containing protein n=1 Tax=Anabaena cylindrica (strain ATCC 27899 / PCC 7122) TaxID=272123 RepID=K9ZRI4_ANACC|nr:MULTISPECIES: DUF928 domain-containing protein [Anabaena]AFZ61379.1 protein of unknown function DUF928 [Anabaena cylindrica PCC 7122]MBD2420375.1 DUF928 domain-containing protein [Anabaena cylindrica FACHB-243]MBY5281867.1 DUF928 domain-containing protein [Anabaena sp. CCAP 1446/1C]MBY5306984.1 DUF928 domain-containing protein [Anabaena sp. CCAP 1446/1C]MCM2406002.1 DUF928 domain-containing protein [Anabaena sp. CCAP 1446/1C]
MRTQDKLISIFYCFSIAMTWSTTNLFLYSKLVQAQSINSILLAKSRKPLDFSGTGRPNNQGGGGSRGICNHTDKNQNNSSDFPVALVPQKMGLTVSEYPTFWVYIPQSYKNLQRVELSVNLFDKKEETKRVFGISYQAKNIHGIVSLTPPKNKKYALEEGKIYTWYITLVCSKEANEQVNYDYIEDTYGSIKRVSSSVSSPNYEDFIRDQIWHDAVTDLGKRLLDNPGNQQLQNEWKNLLKTKGVELDLVLKSITEQPLVSCCEIESSD